VATSFTFGLHLDDEEKRRTQRQPDSLGYERRVCRLQVGSAISFGAFTLYLARDQDTLFGTRKGGALGRLALWRASTQAGGEVTSGAPGLNPRLELGQAKASCFIGITIALYCVQKACELLGLDVRKELDIQGALPVSIEPPLAGWLI
jgi:hypothetical protein